MTLKSGWSMIPMLKQFYKSFDPILLKKNKNFDMLAILLTLLLKYFCITTTRKHLL